MKRLGDACVHVLLVACTLGAGTLVLWPVSVHAQDSWRVNTPYDVRWLVRVHEVESPWVTRPLQAAHRSAWPVFVLATPGALAASRVGNAWSTSDAVALGATAALAGGGTIVLKRIFKRNRPFVSHAFIDPYHRSTSGHADTRFLSDSASMPSGHAALAASLATQSMLSQRSPEYLAIGSVWAASVALSRVWLGVHYPSDILAGTLFGVSVATAVHLIR